MVLAAGYGRRLAPLTDHIPKPLLPVGSRNLLDHAMASLADAGLSKIAVNSHHLGQLIQDHLEGCPGSPAITHFAENEILGTGGALHGARDFLRQADHFLIHNGDVLSDANLSLLIEDHLGSGALATMLLVDWPQVNTVVVDSQRRVQQIGGPLADLPEGWRRLTYTGIAVFRTEILDDIGPGFSSLIDPLVRAKNAHPDSVRGYEQEGLSWNDLGTVGRYFEAIDEAEPIDASHFSIERICGHGSDRKFWRVKVPDHSWVAMKCPPEDQEFDRFCAIGKWLGEVGLGAPTLFNADLAEKSLFMEDLGTGSLFHLMNSGLLPEGDIGKKYSQVLDQLVQLQARTAEVAEPCPEAVDRSLDYGQLRWETDYFRDRFLKGHCGLADEIVGELTPEFEALAKVVQQQPQVLIHRDFQSQNIIFKDGQVRLIDFQGMRLGPVGYDAMSLILDPYVDIPERMKKNLLHVFCQAKAGVHSASELEAMCLAAGLQRIMQALGAYGFLGHFKGKTEYLDHIPRAVSHWQWLMEESISTWNEAETGSRNWLPGPLPRLQRLMAKLR